MTPRTSSSVIVMPVSETLKPLTVVLPATVSDSFVSSMSSLSGVRVNVAVPELSPAVIVKAKSATVE